MKRSVARDRVTCIYPNEDSTIRLIYALWIEKNEEWITGRKYLNMEK